MTGGNGDQTTAGNGVSNSDTANIPVFRPFQSGIAKITSLQALIPEFSGDSCVNPTYFFETLESLTNVEEYTDGDRLVIAKSRIRGPALKHLIATKSLNTEKEYEKFKTKIIEFFEQNESPAITQYQFTHLKMFPSETVRQFAARVTNGTDKFLGTLT